MVEQLDLLSPAAAVREFDRAASYPLVANVADVTRWEPPQEPPVWATSGHPAEWWKFHTEHPEVGRALVGLARPLVRAGHKRIGISLLWETLRYRTMLGSRPDESPWRLNHNHRAFYARWLGETYPELADVFELRESAAERNLRAAGHLLEEVQP